jgi:ribosome biogenesis GTPase
LEAQRHERPERRGDHDGHRGLSPEQKEQHRQRALRNFARRRTPAEERALELERRERLAGRRRAPRAAARGWEQDNEGPDAAEDFEPRAKLRGGRQRSELADSSEVSPTTARGRSARVVAVARDGARLRCDGEDWRLAPQRTELAVGDRVLVETLDAARGLVRLLSREPRRSWVARADGSAAGGERVLAANVDLCLVVLDATPGRFKPRLFDRFRVALAAGGVEALAVLSKLDRCDAATAQARRDWLAQLHGLGAAGLCTSASTGLGLDELRARVRGRVVVTVGHSGVGKSTLLNALDPAGQRATSAVRTSDGKGRHTTTAAQWRELPDGTVLLDTPGIRSLGLSVEQLANLDEAFPEIAVAALECRFGDCRHGAEPECGVRAARAAGAIAEPRWSAFQRLRDGG